MLCRISSAVRLGIVVVLALSLSRASAASPKYQALYSFTAGADGAGPWSGVALDRKGNLYGTTTGGGAYGAGVVFKLKRRRTGDWPVTVLHSFQMDDNGYQPWSRPVFDPAGNLYATTLYGGTNHSGTAFKMAPGPSGWTFNVMYNFCSLPDCLDAGAYGGFALDSAGNLYGVFNSVLELSPSPDGWVPKVLYTFCSKPGCADGNGSYASLILDKKGNLYGTTPGGGANQNAGTVFKVKHMPDGSWKERVLHSFSWSPDDGAEPSWGQLAFDSAGNLYGTTYYGGSHGCGEVACGTLFRLSPQPDGHWKETILYNFDQGAGGNIPGAGVVIDQAGNLYGTTMAGGTRCDCGVVYKLSPNPDDTWTYTVLHSFIGSDGFEPHANMIFDQKGNLYGTTVGGGPGGYGVVFELTP